MVAYNSKVYYVITQGAGLGDSVRRLPVTGNETVLDAISQINGLSQVSSKKIWIARPAPHNFGCQQILPIEWDAITQGAQTATNYQILPGDRLFVAEDELVTFTTSWARSPPRSNASPASGTGQLHDPRLPDDGPQLQPYPEWTIAVAVRRRRGIGFQPVVPPKVVG